MSFTTQPALRMKNAPAQNTANVDAGGTMESTLQSVKLHTDGLLIGSDTIRSARKEEEEKQTKQLTTG